MSFPRQERHKCSLFEEEIPAITYNSGGSYTLRSLLQSTKLLDVSWLFSRRTTCGTPCKNTMGAHCSPFVEDIQYLHHLQLLELL
jgi:hypothetical protein